MNNNDENVVIPEILEQKSQYSKEESASVGVGCLRGIIFFAVSVVLSGVLTIALLRSVGFWWAICIGIVFFLALMLITAYIAITAKNLTVVDCVLPIPISAISAIVFFPIALISLNFFSVVTCIGAGFLLSLGLFLYKSKQIPGIFLLLPAITFAYEILPVSLPTDIDSFIALGGSATSVFVGYLKYKTGSILAVRK
ncbi:MAG: hypothetical protein FWC85_05205 [Elusimicrobia bacterium]|nr:hypothetical protein [Elusimicrobiota bacterium]